MHTRVSHRNELDKGLETLAVLRPASITRQKGKQVARSRDSLSLSVTFVYFDL